MGRMENIEIEFDWFSGKSKKSNKHNSKKKKNKEPICEAFKKRKIRIKNRNKKAALSNIEILDSGVIRIPKGAKFDIADLIKSSVDEAVVSRLDAIISKEGTNKKTPSANMVFNIDELTYVHKKYSEDHIKRTIVVPMFKKDALSEFNYLNSSVIGDILRSSTLAYTYKKLKKKWVELNEGDTTEFTNVLYIPNILIFLNEKTRSIFNQACYINVLFVAYPSLKKLKSHPEASDIADATMDPTNNEVAERVIGDICDAAIRVGAKHIALNPFGHKTLWKKPSLTTDLWIKMIQTKRFQGQMNEVAFCMEDVQNYIHMAAKMNGLKTIDF